MIIKKIIFADSLIELVIGRNWPSQEVWYANDKTSMTNFSEGKFLYTSVLPSYIKSLSADCDKF